MQFGLNMAFLASCVGAILCLYIWLCPYTKVEESFNLQAMHDILFLRTNISKYDHLEFPGVVPRTFIGAIVVSLLSAPSTFLVQYVQASKFSVQYIVRACLGLLVLHAYMRFVRSVQRKFGASVGRWTVALTLTQFHFLFYASRPLPNTFALAVVLHSLADWMRGRHGAFIWSSACAIILFRAELSILCGVLLLVELVTRRLSVVSLLKHSIPAGLVFLGLTIGVDSLFWRRLLWPEGEVLWFNTFLNKSSQWGTSPLLWYFYSVLPRALGASLALVPLGLYWNHAVRPVAGAAILFVSLYSLLPHKELRFIIYVFPVLNTVAATACSRLWQTRKRSHFRSLLAFGVVVHLTLNCLLTTGLIYISTLNYPGGDALQRLHDLQALQPNAHVHIDVYSAQTGISRFTQLRDDWIYSKKENLVPGGEEMMEYTHLLVEAAGGAPRGGEEDPALVPYLRTHRLLEVVHGFHKINFSPKSFPPLTISTLPRIYILKKIS